MKQEKMPSSGKIKEETGIDISNYKIELIDNSGIGESKKIMKTGEEVLCRMNFFVYKIEINDKNSADIKIDLNDDLVEYRWTKLKELPSLKLTPPSTETIKLLPISLS